MLKLSPRIQMAADMVRDGAVVADIGTDHAYLPCALVLDGRCKSALACDINEGPLANALKTVNAFSLSEKIKLRLSDGFKNICPEEAEDFVLCGMGGTLITSLVAATPWLKDPTKRLIIQPQSHAEDIRRYLCENGFSIILENACTDAGKLYCAMCATYTGESTFPNPSFYYIGKLPQSSSPAARLYVEKILSRLKKRFCALEESDTLPLERQNLSAVIGEIEEIIEKW